MPKRSLILFLFCLSFKLCLTAQEPFEPTTHVGVHGGINFSTVSFSPTVKQNFLVSNAFGVVFRHVSERNIGLQIEVNSAEKGWKEIIDSVGSYSRRLSTIDVPLMAAFIAGSRTVRFAFTVGTYVAYLRNEEEKAAFNDPSKYRSYYFKPLENKWEFGFTGGLSAEFHTKFGAFALRASYSHGLNNIFPLNEPEYYYSGSRNQVLHAGLMYFYTF
jgi:hypothetical protein